MVVEHAQKSPKSQARTHGLEVALCRLKSYRALRVALCLVSTSWASADCKLLLLPCVKEKGLLTVLLLLPAFTRAKAAAAPASTIVFDTAAAAAAIRGAFHFTGIMLVGS